MADTCRKCGAAIELCGIYAKASTPNPEPITQWWASQETGWNCPASPGDEHEVNSQ